MNAGFADLAIENVNPGTFSGKWLSAKDAPSFEAVSPINSQRIASVLATTTSEYEEVLRRAQDTFVEWSKVPAPQRGQVIREIGNALRDARRSLGLLVTTETGKIWAEGEGEVQEAIDIADFAVGLSRQLYGKTMHSERSGHRMYEQWHPLGVVGVITAFNFPVAVWAWNAMLAAVCGDTVVWKPSEKTPLCAVATIKICSAIAAKHGFPGLFTLITSNGPQLGERLAADSRVPLISATGSCRMGKAVAQTVAKRLGKTILELGGNNAVIVLKDADLDLVVRSTLFGAVGTAGQRCTTTRRLIVERSIEDDVIARLSKCYRQVKIGDPREAGVLMGPLIDEAAVRAYLAAIARAKQEGGEIICGGECVKGMASSLYVLPTIVRANKSMPIVREETFAPILYVIGAADLSEAIAIQNDVPQGLSSAIFTRNVQHAEQFLSSCGSDCGIANVNIGTSGAEIGGAFGGEKETGGGRESGSDSWQQYMRRQTNTVNFSNSLPLAQGIKFEL